MIIDRYLKKEIFTTLLAVTTVLLIIFIFQQFVSYMRSAALGRLTVHTVAILVSLQVPVLLTMLLPLSLYLGVIVALSRLYADSEMTILFVSGMSRKRLFNIVGGFSALVMIVVAVLALWISPKMENYSTQLFQRDEAQSLQLLNPGRFNIVANNKWVFYISDTKKDGKLLENVFAAQNPQFKKTSGAEHPVWGVLYAQNGRQVVDSKTGQTFLVLHSGDRYLGMPGMRDYKIVNFKEYGILLKKKDDVTNFKTNAIPTSVLLTNLNNKSYASELHWRIAMPIMVLVLTLFALFFARVKPRRGRFAKMVPAVLIYILYANLLFLARAWLSRGVLATDLGFWWAHAAMLFIVLLFFVVSTKTMRR